MNLFSVFFCQRGVEHYRLNVFIFPFEILDPPKKDVAASTISTEGEETQTMRVLKEDDIPLGGEYITLLYSIQVIAFNNS